MPISGLMITLSNDASLAEEAVHTLSSTPGIELGEKHDRWLAISCEPQGKSEARDTHEWIERLQGVDQVDVIMVGIEEPPQ